MAKRPHNYRRVNVGIVAGDLPIFDYMDLMHRHRLSRKAHVPATRDESLLRERERHLIAEAKSINGRGPELCWSGVCHGCGRTLISATWPNDKAGGRGHRNPVYCTRKCRADHGA